jgi:hypothetical protein
MFTSCAILIPFKSPSEEEDQGEFIVAELNTRLGQPLDASRDKKYMRKLEKGSF